MNPIIEAAIVVGMFLLCMAYVAGIFDRRKR